MIERIREYHHKLQILRQIMSNKAARNHKVNTSANIATVVVSSFLTFMGFSGLPNIQRYMALFLVATPDAVEFVFNFLILLLFILVMLHLVFRFGVRESEADRAVVSLTHLINQIDDQLEAAGQGYVLDPASVNIVREKYDTLILSLPSNSDREFLRAKRDFQQKQLKKSSLGLTAQGLFDSTNQQRVINSVILQSELLVSILQAIRDVDPSLYLGGGLVRNAVWDYLHGYKRATPIDDVDIVYFDQLRERKEQDVALEADLRRRIPNLKWSVKNQARMHLVNGEDPYTTFEDAVRKWPETATSIAVRQTAGGDLEIIAPHGYSDLFRLVVRPTHHFRNRIEDYRRRIQKKQWQQVWPHLLVLED
jgi:hypothetical protein